MGTGRGAITLAAIPTEKTKFWRDRQFENLELLRATYVTHTFAPHFHEGFAIGVIQAGVETFKYRNKRYFSPQGTLVIINPGEIHTGEAAVAEGWSYRMLYPAASILQQAASQVAGRPRDVPFFPTPVVYDTPMAQLMLRLHLALEDETTSALERESRLLWTLGQLIVRHADDRPLSQQLRAERSAVQAARDYLDTHFADDVTLDTLADQVNLSPFHLLRVFKQEMGLSPHAYLTQTRIWRARKLLLSGFPIADVAAQTGFADQSHLTRRFKRIVGVTPGQYRPSS